jgi:HD-GYP domain-containing protein (c-di-GMP phosphodiesterase class II)
MTREKKAMSDWPENFDFETDEICQTVFKPFIERELAALKAFDAQRPADITYIFHEHAERVARNVEKTCLHMGLGERVARNMYWAILPHDIGKSRLPVEIWDSEEKPSDGMKKFRRTHTMLGAQMVDEYFGDIDHPFKDLMRDIMLYHHAQMDSGGPLGKNAAELSAPVRLAAIVEAYDGWRIFRPHYGDRDISPAGVLKRMREEKGADIFDMDLLGAFEAMKLSELDNK